VQVTAIAETEEREVVNFAVPIADVTVLDTWHVLGLRGTGSCDFSLEDCFVPTRRAFVRRPDDPSSVRRRGGAIFAMPRLSGVTYEHAGIAYGLGRRALTLLQDATDPVSGHPGLASRGDVLAEIGRLSTRLVAAGSWVATLHDGILSEIEAGAIPDPAVATTAQSSACLVTEIAVEICTALFRYSGARGLYVPNEAERLFRDANAAAEHVVVGNHVYLDQARIPFSNVERS
jgi:alkylation response protein AidB-like acyl-CoA dehydrogenase